MMFWLDSQLEIVGCHSNTVTRVGGRENYLPTFEISSSSNIWALRCSRALFSGGTRTWCICQCVLVITLWLLPYQSSHKFLTSSLFSFIMGFFLEAPVYLFFIAPSCMTNIINIISLTKSHEKNQKSIFRYFRHSYIVTLYWSLPVTNWTTRFCFGNTLFLHKQLTDRKYIIQPWLISFGHFLFFITGQVKTSGIHIKENLIWK